MLAHQLEAETVQRADVGVVKKRKLLCIMEIIGLFLQFIFQCRAKVLA